MKTTPEFKNVSRVVEKMKITRLRIGIVRSLFRSSLTEAMQSVVEKRARKLGVKIAKIALARGALDTPLLVQRLLSQQNLDGVVVLGAVIRGKTKHDEVVVQETTRALIEVSLRFNKPVGIGIIGPKVTLSQAKRRVTEYSQGAMDAVVLSALQNAFEEKRLIQ